MTIDYREGKALPSDQLYALFHAVGWAGEEIPAFMRAQFTKPFLQSDVVVSAWAGERLIGCARVLSDGVVRSIQWDLAVLPEYQSAGINAVMLQKMTEYLESGEIDYFETNLNLETNTQVMAQRKYFDAEQHKRRRSYIKDLSPKYTQ